MIADLKPYPAMKDSGVRWLGEVPEHWEVRKLGQIGKLLKGNGGNKEDEVAAGVPCVRYGDLYTTHTYFIRKSRSFVTPARANDYTRIAFGDVLFAASGETIDEIGKSAVNLIQSEACCGGDVILFRPGREVEARYMGYATDCRPAATQKASMGRGITVKHIYGDQLRRLTVALPPLREQAAIVRFLDHSNRRIRRYFGAKQKLIKLLEEQKQAIVYRAVTRGLDPNVRLKPSGIEWLGDVPEHWEVRKLGQIAKVLNGATPSRMEPGYWQGGTIPWLSSGKVNDGVVETSSELVTERAIDECSISLVPRGSVILGLVGQGKTRGMSALLAIDACINQNLAALVPHCGLDGRFLHFLLAALYKQIRELGRGGNQEALNCDLVARLRLPIPPLHEQEALCRYLEQAVGGVVRTHGRVEREIALLREYRTRLITDVVTGKLDVRAAAAELPDEADEPDPPDDTATADTDESADDADLDAAEEEDQT
jgi:type I restriction enzyme S subunit